jgi:glycosyltransferase involved in cell wall biosynthesis
MQHREEHVWALLNTQQHALIPLHSNVAVAIKAASKILGKKPTLLWQYVPNSFSKNGMPVLLAAQVFWLWLSGYRQSIFFHEVAVRTWGYGWKQLMLSVTQKILANKLIFFTHHAATSIALYRGYFLFKKPVLIPVGSNLPFAWEPAKLLPEDASHFFCFTNRCTTPLLQALIAFATTNGSQIKLHLAGNASAECQQQLQQIITATGAGHFVQLHGTLSNEALANLMAGCDIVLQPQPLEPNGQGGVSAKNGTIAAAMQAGKPIITMAGDMTEPAYFIHTETCWLLHKDDSRDWLHAINAIQNNPTLKSKLASGALQVYQQYFRTEILANAVEKILLPSSLSGGEG